MTRAKNFGIIEGEFWDDRRFYSLSPVAQLIYLRLFTDIPNKRKLHRVLDKFDTVYLMTRFCVSEKDLVGHLEEMQKSGLIKIESEGPDIKIRFPDGVKDKYLQVKCWEKDVTKNTPIFDVLPTTVPGATDVLPTSVPCRSHVGPTSVPGATDVLPTCGGQEKVLLPNNNNNKTKTVTRTATETSDFVAEIAGACAPEKTERSLPSEELDFIRLLCESFERDAESGRRIRTTMLKGKFRVNAASVPEILEVGKERLMLAVVYTLLMTQEKQLRNPAGMVVDYTLKYPIPDESAARCSSLLRRIEEGGNA